MSVNVAKVGAIRPEYASRIVVRDFAKINLHLNNKNNTSK